MKYIKTFESKNIGNLYHFTSIYDAIDIVELNRLFSTQSIWGTTYRDRLLKKHQGQISLTRDKFLNHKKPKGVKLGVRFTFDGNKLSDDYKIKPVKFSSLWEESEEAVFTIDGNKKRDQIRDLKKYILSIDLMPYDIYRSGSDLSDYFFAKIEQIGYTEHDYKLNRPLVNFVKSWIEEQGFNARLVHKTYNKKSYLSDKTFESQKTDFNKLSTEEIKNQILNLLDKLKIKYEIEKTDKNVIVISLKNSKLFSTKIFISVKTLGEIRINSVGGHFSYNNNGILTSHFTSLISLYDLKKELISVLNVNSDYFLKKINGFI